MDRPAAQASSVAGGRPRPVRTELAELMKLSWPVVISRLGIMAMGLSDAIVVGRYSATQLGYHALGWAPTSVVVTMAIGLLSGVQVMTARAIGEGRRQETGAVLRRGLSYSLWIGMISAGLLALGGPPFLHAIGLEKSLADGASRVLLVFCLSLPAYALSTSASFWMEGLSRPGPGAWAMWIANGVNLAFDLLLVPGTFGLPALGAMGGAWATTGARTFLAVAMLGYIALMPEARALGVFDKPERNRAAEAEQRRIGFGAGASNFFEVAAFASMNIIAGWIGGLAVAAWAIVLNVAAIVFMVPLGLSTGAAVRVGRAYGARDPAGVVRAGLIAFAVTGVFGVLVSLAVWPNAALIASAYTGNPLTLAMAVPALALSCLMYFPDSLQVVTAQALRARGDVWLPSGTHLTSYILIMMPLAWWLAIPMGLQIMGLVWAIVIASVVSAGLLLARFWMLSRRD
ncbi:MAG: efflux family protein [Phenylobacterium sp.]|jgi:MATE family multidrug resistance protein|uniref:MATE family efflux transporter n=1 Tax=Phenylobacterium sp. TaxID=1871053 RepID=UPI00262C7C26|nr:MATE family efflux transporter [Phenylobacterium sp.]MDB5434185.1 efflux family protein [Phenylobacterium sp.]MDB5499956.1 efflux family protein [Phenylobacterium sp.]